MSATTTTTTRSAHMPPLLWAQRQQYVFVTVPLQDASHVTVELPEDGAVLSLSLDDADGVHYACALRLYAPVAAEESRHVVRPRQIEIKLKKKPKSSSSSDGGAEGKAGGSAPHDEDTAWPRLTQDKNKHPQIQIDWHKWRDADEDNNADAAALDGDLANFGMQGGLDENDADGDGDGMQSELLSRFMQQRAMRDAAEHADEADAQAASGAGEQDGHKHKHKPCHGHDALHKEQRQRAADGVDNDEDMPPLEDYDGN